MTIRNICTTREVPEYDPDDHGCRMLWAAVFMTALDDLAARGREYAKAQAWVRSERDGAGSFLWVCDVLGLDAETIRQRLQ